MTSNFTIAELHKASKIVETPVYIKEYEGSLPRWRVTGHS